MRRSTGHEFSRILQSPREERLNLVNPSLIHALALKLSCRDPTHAEDQDGQMTIADVHTDFRNSLCFRCCSR